MECEIPQNEILDLEESTVLAKEPPVADLGHYEARHEDMVVLEDNTSLTSDIQSLDVTYATSDRDFYIKKKVKKGNRYKCAETADLISWPSDSDITVLRLKIFPTSNLDFEGAYDICVPGDGAHLTASPSMVNLVTLVAGSDAVSKDLEMGDEYLIPLSSWDPGSITMSRRSGLAQRVQQIAERYFYKTPSTQTVFDAITLASQDEYNEEQSKVQDDSDFVKVEKVIIMDAESSTRVNVPNKKVDNSQTVSDSRSRLARFMRLYFCPCCSCLYDIENKKSRSSTPDAED